MEDSKKIMAEVTQITLNIKTNYPELYRTLGENPVTIPDEKHPDIDNKEMNDYLESLKGLLKSHIENKQVKRSRKE